MSEAIWIAIIGGIISIVGAGMTVFFAQRTQARADAVTKISGAAVSLADRFDEDNEKLRAEVGELREQVDQLRHEFRALLQGAWALHGQVKQLGGKPVYTPPSDTGPKPKKAGAA